MIKKFVTALQAIEEKEEGKSLPEANPSFLTNNNNNSNSNAPLPSLDEELADMEVEKEQRKNLMDGLVSPDFVIHSMTTHFRIPISSCFSYYLEFK